MAAAAALLGCGGGSSGSTAVAQTPAAPKLVTAPVTVVANVRSPASYALPAQPVISFDVRVPTGGRLDINAGGRAFRLTRPNAGVPLISGAPLALPGGWLGGGWRHVEFAGSRLSIDGRRYGTSAAGGTRLTFAGRAQLGALVISAATDRGALLLHRVAELHARIPVGQFPVGADVRDEIHYNSSYWTNGFWPGALWEAAALAPGGGCSSAGRCR